MSVVVAGMERLRLIHDGVTRIQEGMYVGLGLGVMYGIGMLGIKILLLISPLLLAEGLYLTLVNASLIAFLLFRVINGITALVLYVLILVALYRLGSEFNADRLKIGVIITIVTVFILISPNIIAAIIGIVGIALMLMGLGDVRRTIENKLGTGG
ncbi:hypothetical protein [Vulcanisaeta sp. JCM 14467]|uniref:hypothetical protein n=1 Tax=Vulcanisaeta sp. JCM 14467 TaxID=1295370 RepID=UPI000AA668B1|nr:hypothetical protein [Vulcanisaeta sp. JCM 14467]